MEPNEVPFRMTPGEASYAKAAPVGCPEGPLAARVGCTRSQVYAARRGRSHVKVPAMSPEEYEHWTVRLRRDRAAATHELRNLDPFQS